MRVPLTTEGVGAPPRSGPPPSTRTRVLAGGRPGARLTGAEGVPSPAPWGRRLCVRGHRLARRRSGHAQSMSQFTCVVVCVCVRTCVLLKLVIKAMVEVGVTRKQGRAPEGTSRGTSRGCWTGEAALMRLHGALHLAIAANAQAAWSRRHAEVRSLDW